MAADLSLLGEELDVEQLSPLEPPKATTPESKSAACLSLIGADTESVKSTNRFHSPVTTGSIVNDLVPPANALHHAAHVYGSKLDQQVVEPHNLHNAASNESDPTAVCLEQSSYGQAEVLQQSSYMAVSGDALQLIDSVCSDQEYKPQQARLARTHIPRRIAPRSFQHAHQLGRNRIAATAYRNRKKEEVDMLQQKAREAVKKKKARTLEIRTLSNEEMVLRKELLKHCNCVCQKIGCPVWARIAELRQMKKADCSEEEPQLPSLGNREWVFLVDWPLRLEKWS